MYFWECNVSCDILRHCAPEMRKICNILMLYVAIIEFFYHLHNAFSKRFYPKRITKEEQKQLATLLAIFVQFSVQMKYRLT